MGVEKKIPKCCGLQTETEGTRVMDNADENVKEKSSFKIKELSYPN